MGVTAPVYVHEKVHRSIVAALMSNFSSVAQAVQELVDNAVDWRQGQDVEVHIRFDRKKTHILVESDGGRGMGVAELQDWLNWGDGDDHPEDHIGYYHQGGKAAAGFLGDHVKLWCKRRDSGHLWFIEDRDWATRDTLRDYALEPADPAHAPLSVREASQGRGHVRIEIRKAHKDRRWNVGTLRAQLASTYRTLLREGHLKIWVDDNEIRPLDLPIEEGTRLELKVKLGSRSAWGWAARLRRNELRADVTVAAGLRLLSQSRLIREGEWFGYNHEGKGALNSLVGEVRVRGFRPNANKTDFVDRSTEAWKQVGDQILDQLQPLISRLRRSGEEARATKAEKKRATRVWEELSQILKEMATSRSDGGGNGLSGDQEGIEPAGRAAPQDATTRRSAFVSGNGSDQTPQTPPPQNAVGALHRVIPRREAGLPQFRIDSWDRHQRSAWVCEDGRQVIKINKSFPCYQMAEGREEYLAETALLEFFVRDPECPNPKELVDRVSRVLAKWGSDRGFGGVDQPDREAELHQPAERQKDIARCDQP
jgi:hypothetical protein